MKHKKLEHREKLKSKILIDTLYYGFPASARSIIVVLELLILSIVIIAR